MKNQNLGKIATDKLSGFTGRVTGFCTYLPGCGTDQYQLVAEADADNKHKPNGSWIDAARLVFDDGEALTIETE